jgi:hypothetical protein
MRAKQHFDDSPNSAFPGSGQALTAEDVHRLQQTKIKAA